MKKILIGLLFLTIPLNLLGPAYYYINYTPAFVGYALIFLGLSQGWRTQSLAAGRTVAMASAVLSAVLWAVLLCNVGSALLGQTGWLLELLMTYRLLAWCEEQEDWEWGWRIRRLRGAWYVMAGGYLASFVLGATMFGNVVFGFVWYVAAVLGGLYYAYTFYRLTRLIPREVEP